MPYNPDNPHFKYKLHEALALITIREWSGSEDERSIARKRAQGFVVEADTFNTSQEIIQRFDIREKLKRAGKQMGERVDTEEIATIRNELLSPPYFRDLVALTGSSSSFSDVLILTLGILTIVRENPAMSDEEFINRKIEEEFSLRQALHAGAESVIQEERRKLADSHILNTPLGNILALQPEAITDEVIASIRAIRTLHTFQDKITASATIDSN